MSFNDNLDLSPFLNGNQLIQLPDIQHQLKNGLSFTAFFNQLMANVSNNKDKCDVWNYVLLDIIDNNVVNESMLSDVLSITIDKTRSESLTNRIFSCKMLTKLSRRLNESIFTDKILPLVQYLCHDLQPSIRAHISKQMIVLSQNFSLETIKTQILPQLMELTNDSELIVRIASIESLIDLIPKFDDEFNKQIILPQIISLFDFAFKLNDSSLCLVFMNFGKLCQILPKNVISHEQWFLDYYCNIFLISNDFQSNAKISNFSERDIQCRILLALYFPTLLHIYGSNDTLFSILNFLCSDIDINVVRTIASVFNEISVYMKNPFKLYSQLSKLMSQRSIIVIKELNPYLSSLLIDAIKSTPNENKNDLFVDLLQNIIGCENTICLNLDWRLQIDFYYNLIQVLMYFPVNATQTVFLPLLLNRIITARPIPLRIGTSRCVISLYQNIPVLSETLNLYEWFVNTFCYGKSCHQRMLYINVCQLINELCDANILVKYFLDPLLSLRTDKVPNIRLNVCKCLKSFQTILKSRLMNGRTQQMKGLFEEMLFTETDRDVIIAIDELIHELDIILNDELRVEEVDELTQEFVNLSIDSPPNSCQLSSSDAEVNNNSVDDNNDKALNEEKNSSPKHKSSLPQLIRSQSNANTISKCLPQNHINDNGLYSKIPSKIPKPITKCSK